MSKKSVSIDLGKISKVVTSGGRKATWAALDYLATQSKQQVPLDQGTLKNSCTVDVNEDGSQGTVSYDTPYAVVQHENTALNHQRGRKGKYLEDPAMDAGVQETMKQLAQQAMAGEIK